MSAILANYAYAEGEWTPTIVGATPATGVIYDGQIGKYTRIGNRIFADFNVSMTNVGTGGAGNVALASLPIPVADGEPVFFRPTAGSGFTGAGTQQLYLIPIATSLSAFIVANVASVGTVFITYDLMTAPVKLIGQCTYSVSMV